MVLQIFSLLHCIIVTAAFKTRTVSERNMQNLNAQNCRQHIDESFKQLEKVLHEQINFLYEQIKKFYKNQYKSST